MCAAHVRTDVAPAGLPPRWRCHRRWWFQLRAGMHLRPARFERERCAVVQQTDSLTRYQFVLCLRRPDVNADVSVAVHEPETNSIELRGQSRAQRKDVAVVSQTSKPGNHSQPCASQCAQMETILCIPSQVPEIHEGSFAKIVVG
jgi:hypothetical protein